MTVTRQVTYDDYQPYVKNGPVVDLTLHGPGGPNGAKTAPVAVAIVDTGADYAQLNLNLATYVGLDPVNNGQPIKVATAGGTVTLHELVVDLELLGQTLQVTVHFGSGAAALLGLQGLFQAVQAAGFDTTEWLQQWHPKTSATAQSTAATADDSDDGSDNTPTDKSLSVLRGRPYPRITWGDSGKGKITWHSLRSNPE